MIRNLLIFLLLAAMPAEAQAGLMSGAFCHHGLERSYRLYVPDGLSRFPGPRPLVLVLHGGGGSSREVRYSTRGRFDSLAEQNGFLVLYPDAVNRIWDTGSGEMSRELRPRRDDVGFLGALIAEIARDHPVDPTRVFATGVSRGGMMAFALACDTPGLLRAIAPVAMPLPSAEAADCARGGPLGFLLTHGTADPFVPYTGGPINLGRRDRDRVLSAVETMELFARRNRCDGVVAERIGRVEHRSLTGCALPTAFYSVEGGGHGWPGGRKVRRDGRAGPVNTDISAPDAIWAFFSQF
ncbi:MAG: alpha/beta hydrolase family esterase [Albidovulum sp.]